MELAFAHRIASPARRREGVQAGALRYKARQPRCIATAGKMNKVINDPSNCGDAHQNRIPRPTHI